MRTQHRGTAGGLGLALLSAASFAMSGSFARSLTDAGWSPAAAVAARVGVAALMLAVPALLAMRGRWPALRRNGVMVVIYGLVAVAGGQIFFFNAIQRLSVGVALLLEYLGVVLVVGWMWVRHGHLPRRFTLAGSALALVGLMLVIDVTGGTPIDAVGVLWALAGAFGLAAYFVLSSRIPEDLPPLALAGGGMTVGFATLLVLGGLGAVPMRASFAGVAIAGHRTSFLVPVIGLSLFGSAIAYVAGIAAARRLGPKLSSFIGLTEVLFAVLFAWLILGELPSGTQLAGGLLILGGVALVRVDELALQVRRQDALGAPTLAHDADQA